MTQDTVLKFFRNNSRRAGTVGLSLTPEGVAVARVMGRDASAPRLDVLAVEACSPEQRPGCLAGLVERLGLKGAPCVLVMEPGSYSLLQVESPDVQPEELRAAIRWRIRDLIDYHIDDAVVDVFDIPGQSQRGRPRMMYAVSARSAEIQRRVDLMRGAGLEPQAIDVGELALRNVADLFPEQGTALLYFTADGGLITLQHQGELCLARTLDAGALRLQQWAADGTYGADPDAGARQLESLALEVQRSLDYFDSFFALPPVSALVLAPTEPPTPGLADYLNANLAVTARPLDLTGMLEMTTSPSEGDVARGLLAVGGALRSEAKRL